MPRFKRHPKTPPQKMVMLRVKEGQTCFYKRQYKSGETFYGPEALLKTSSGAASANVEAAPAKAGKKE